MKGLRRGVGAVFVAALAVWAVLGCAGDEKPRPGQAPDFEVVAVDGSTVRLSSYRGAVVVLDFWATYCPPCKEALRHEAELQRRYGPKGLQVIALALDRDAEEIRKYLEKHPLPFPVALATDEIRKAYGGVTTIPYAVFIDRTGRIRHRKIGFVPGDDAELERWVARLVAEGAEPLLGP